jgi:hypothetical protein
LNPTDAGGKPHPAFAFLSLLGFVGPSHSCSRNGLDSYAGIASLEASLDAVVPEYILAVVDLMAKMRRDSGHQSCFVWIDAAGVVWHIEVVVMPCGRCYQMPLDDERVAVRPGGGMLVRVGVSQLGVVVDMIVESNNRDRTAERDQGAMWLVTGLLVVLVVGLLCMPSLAS